MAMQFLKGLTRWFHFRRTPTTIEPIQEVPAEPQQLVTRRNLLFGLGATAIVAAIPEIPFGRVWSFPRIIRTSFADPGRIDMLNLDAWEKYPWASGAQSVALQLEKVRAQLPVLYETNSNLFALMERDMVMYGRGERISTRSMRIALTDGEIHDYATNGVPERGFKELTLADAKRIYPPGRISSYKLSPLAEAGKVSRLVDRYGDALADKVDRTVVKPVRDELESICDLVNNG